jgi:hypothetical protein
MSVLAIAVIDEIAQNITSEPKLVYIEMTSKKYKKRIDLMPSQSQIICTTTGDVSTAT